MTESCVVLAIETSCDETSAAVVENGRYVLSNIIASQVDLHKKFGGVVPEIASRKHLEMVIPVIHEALEASGAALSDIDVLAVTKGPGLVGALLVGVSAVKAIAFARKLPLIGVNHIEGHIYANFLEHRELNPPFVCLIVSGGHTQLVYMKDHGCYEIMGQTRDDAAGEAFDKAARALNLGYPGGPVIDKLAREGDPNKIEFPRAYLEEGSLDFSFSGVKTALLNYINSKKQKNQEIVVEDVAAGYQEAIVDVLVDKTFQAVKYKKVNVLTLAGGVAANSRLRQKLVERGEEEGVKILYPGIHLCTDNAAMIASAAFYRYKKGDIADLTLNAHARLSL